MKIVLHRLRALSEENRTHARTMMKALEAMGLVDDGQTPPLHERTRDLVDRFALALKDKLAAAERKYGYSDGWADPGWMDECRAKLIGHINKGDPRDVAAYCAFLWHHGWRTSLRIALDAAAKTASEEMMMVPAMLCIRHRVPECPECKKRTAMPGKCEHGLTTRECLVCASPKYGERESADGGVTGCRHRLADARNSAIKSGYVCVDCGATFPAADISGEAATARDALARRCLWIAYCWNDHNFDDAHLYARREAEAHGIKSFEDANEWLARNGLAEDRQPDKKDSEPVAQVVEPLTEDEIEACVVAAFRITRGQGSLKNYEDTFAGVVQDMSASKWGLKLKENA